MTRIAIYYPIHFIGIFLLFLAIGGMCISCRNGFEKKDNPSKKFLAITHGIALLMIVIGGMGLMTGYQYHVGGMPGWIILKLVIWVIFGCSSLIIYKLPKFATVTLFAFLALVAFSGMTAKFKSVDYYKNHFRAPALNAE
jgi:uncharacterized membrane protein SirB2